MQEVMPEPGWPQSWIESREYDREEVFGPRTNWGYAYAYANRKNETLNLITEAVKPGATVLDIAAAQGNFTLALADSAIALRGTICAPNSLDMCNENTSAALLSTCPATPLS